MCYVRRCAVPTCRDVGTFLSLRGSAPLPPPSPPVPQSDRAPIITQVKFVRRMPKVLKDKDFEDQNLSSDNAIFRSRFLKTPGIVIQRFDHQDQGRCLKISNSHPAWVGFLNSRFFVKKITRLFMKLPDLDFCKILIREARFRSAARSSPVVIFFRTLALSGSALIQHTRWNGGLCDTPVGLQVVMKAEWWNFYYRLSVKKSIVPCTAMRIACQHNGRK